nr:lipid-A-disaccharide synthase [Pseudobdellovibrionaceae bacterium]
ATLMVGLLEKPMVIMYKTSWLTSVIARFVVKGYFGLVNLVLNKEAVPEIFQEDANPKNLEKLLMRYILEPEYKSKVIEDLKKIPSLLGEVGATERVAKSLEAYVCRK